MKKPLVWLVILFSLGIAAASVFRIALGWLYLTAGIFLLPAVLFLKKNIISVISLSILIFLCGMIWFKNYAIIPRGHIRRFNYQRGEVYALKGYVNSLPRYQNNKTSFLFQSAEISGADKKQICRGEVLAIVGGELKLEYGQELILEAQLQHAFGEYLRRQGIFLIARVKTRDFARSTGLNKGWLVRRLILKFKSWVETKFESNLTPICAGIIEAMVLGEEKNIPAKIYKDMIRSGTVHILVVSGSNVGVVSFILILLLKIFRIKRRLRFFFCVFLLLGYCFLTGASNPVVRAVIMAVIFLFAYFVKRQTDIYNSCAASALIILIINPRQIFNIGFQLSFASVLAIAFFYPRLKKLLKLEQLKSRALRFLAESCMISFSAWLGTAGLIAGYFKIISPITVLANIFIVPLASLITLSGFSLLVFQNVSAHLTSSFAAVNELLVSMLLGVNRFLLQLPYAYFYFN